VSSILAVNPDNGSLKWYYQAVPGDSWDFDNVQQMILADLQINGRARKVLVQASKNGFVHVLDRSPGEFLSATPIAPVNWTSGPRRCRSSDDQQEGVLHDGRSRR
jgi:glucose dehydrogenase